VRGRPGPRGAMADEDLVGAIRRLLADSPFRGEGHRKLRARPRFAGVRTSRRRVLRPTREHGLPAHQRAGHPRGPKAHDGTVTPGGSTRGGGRDGPRTPMPGAVEGQRPPRTRDRPVRVVTVGLDPAESVLRLHGVDARGQAVLAERSRRGAVLGFFAALPPRVVATGACGTAHHRARGTAHHRARGSAVPCVRSRRGTSSPA
jgi:hypothetical protein